ncbi:MAG: LysR family transcriptional regulator [Rhodobacteraceae bacterium]|nr:LysR family transcriptional regulator [Paracoccaceae bacterium]
MNYPPDPDWNQLRAFITTAQTGSLSAAARQLGLTQPTLSRQVAALEEHLQIALFERVGRGLVLTETGRTLLEDCTGMGAAATRFALRASGQSQKIEGRVRISASDVLCAHLLPPVITELQEIAPRLEIEVLATNDLSDLLRREADIAIRHVRPTEPELIARSIGDGSAHLYAARRYLERRGCPDEPRDLAGHDLISLGDTDLIARALTEAGMPVSTAQFRVISQSTLTALSFARAGLGIVIMSDMVAQALPDLVQLFPGHPPVSFPIWLTAHREVSQAARIRLVFDHLRDALLAAQPSA